MRTSLSASRWIRLLALAVVMLVSASQVDSFASHAHDCCQGGQTRKVNNIKACYKQEYRPGCRYDAYVIESSSSNKPICVQAAAQWLLNRVNTKDLSCRREFSPRRRFRVLDDEDDEDDEEW